MGVITDTFADPTTGPRAIPLTNATGTELTKDNDARAFYVLASSGAETIYFYTDWNGLRYVSIKNINVTAATAVGCTLKWEWYVSGEWKEKPSYTMELTGSQVLSGVCTDYPLIEDVPHGTKSRIAITTTDTVTVAVNAMARYV